MADGSPHTPQTVEIFSTGMTTDLRKIIRVNRKILRPFQSIQHFDVYPDRLVPKRDWVLDATATSNKLTRFAYFDDTSGYTLWGLGLDGTNHPLLLKKSGDPITGTWATPANNVSSAAAASLINPFLFGYLGNLYYLASGSLSRYNVAGATMTNGFKAISATHTAMPVVHHRSGNAYFFFDNSVYRLDPSDNWLLAQQVPSNMYITGAYPLGNNLAITAAPLNGSDHSQTYLWDLGETTLPVTNTFTEVIDWGKGISMHVANLLGNLVGVSNEYLDSSLAQSKGRMVVHTYAGTVAQEVSHITADATATAPISNSYFTDGEKLYFPATIPLQGDPRIAIWSVDSSGTINMEAVEPTATSGMTLTSCYRLGNYWFIARSDNNVYRTNDQASFTAPSIIETTIYGDRFLHSEFFGATVAFEPLLSGQSVTLKYRPVGTQTWTSLGTQSKVGSINLDSLGTTTRKVPQLDEYQFRIESLGATITGLYWSTDLNDQNTYDR